MPEYVKFVILNQDATLKLNDILGLHIYINRIPLEGETKYYEKLKSLFLIVNKTKFVTLEMVQQYIEIRSGDMDETSLAVLDELLALKVDSFNPASLFFFLNHLEEEVFCNPEPDG